MSEAVKDVFQRYIIGLFPELADMAIVSSDGMEKKTSWSTQVMKAYGYGPEDRQEIKLDDGYYWLQKGSQKPILFIVAVSEKQPTVDNILQNLFNGIGANQHRMNGLKVWMPFLGTGTGNLTLLKSLQTMILVLQSLKNDAGMHDIHFWLSIPKNRSGLELFDFINSGADIFIGPVIESTPDPLIQAFLKETRRKFFYLPVIPSREDVPELLYKANHWVAGDDSIAEAFDKLSDINDHDYVLLGMVMKRRGSFHLRIYALGQVTNNPMDGSSLDVYWSVRNIKIELQRSRYTGYGIVEIDGSELEGVLSEIGIAKLTEAGLFAGTQPVRPNNKVTIPGLISDSDKGEDYMDILRDVRAFARIMASQQFSPPLAIALLGRYGTGKSFFMRTLRAEVEKLSAGPQDIYCKGVVQIHFNAWSYMDANLWASLMNRIFEHLYEYISKETKSDELKRQIKQKLSEELNSTRQQVNELEAQKQKLNEDITNLKKKKGQLDKELEYKINNINKRSFLSVVRRINEKFDVAGKVEKALQSNSSYKELKKRLAQLMPEEFWKDPTVLYEEIRSKRTFLTQFFNGKKILWNTVCILVILSFIVYLPLIIGFSTDRLKDVNFAVLQASLSGLTLVLGYYRRYKKTCQELQPLAASFWQIKTEYESKIASAQEQYDKTTEQLRLDIVHKQSQVLIVEQEVQKAKVELESLKYRIDNAIGTEALYSFIEERKKSEDYRKHLGLVSIIQRDFEVLSDLFDAHNKEKSAVAFRSGFKKPLERIILYIDDLDRCSEERIVEVLGAVNLLMAFPLFMVVVGVDPRWIKNALRNRYKLELGADEEGHRDVISSSNYLEKIFQVSFKLKEPDDAQVKNMLTSLSNLSSERTAPALSLAAAFAEDTAALPESPDTGIREVPDASAGEESWFAPDSPREHEDFPGIDTPERLQITPMEIELMSGLSALIGNNPRTIKRFLNTYRIIKAHEDLIYSKDNEERELKMIMFLIALAVGPFKQLKARIWTFIAESPEMGQRLGQYLKGKRTAKDPYANELKQLGQLLSSGFYESLGTEPLSVFKKHVSFVERFIFDD